jgi:hypothetical protein
MNKYIIKKKIFSELTFEEFSDAINMVLKLIKIKSEKYDKICM